MKAIQLIVAAVLFVLACLICISQTIATKSLFVFVTTLALCALTAGLVHLSWTEIKEEEQ